MIADLAEQLAGGNLGVLPGQADRRLVDLVDGLIAGVGRGDPRRRAGDVAAPDPARPAGSSPCSRSATRSPNGGGGLGATILIGARAARLPAIRAARPSPTHALWAL